MATASTSGAGGGRDPPPPATPSRLPATWDPATIDPAIIRWLRHVLTQIAYWDNSCTRFSMDDEMLSSIAFRLLTYSSEVMRHAARQAGRLQSRSSPAALTTANLRIALILVAGWSVGSPAITAVQNVHIVRGGPPRRTTRRCAVVNAASLPSLPRPTGAQLTLPTELPSTVTSPETYSLLERSARLMPTPTTARGLQVYQSGCYQTTNEMADDTIRMIFNDNGCSASNSQCLEWFRAVLQYLAFHLMTLLNNHRSSCQLSRFGAMKADAVQSWVDTLPNDLEAVMRLAEVSFTSLNTRDATGPPFQRARVFTIDAGSTVAVPPPQRPASPGVVRVGARQYPEQDTSSDSDSAEAPAPPAKKKRR